MSTPYVTAEELREEIQSNTVPSMNLEGLYDRAVKAASKAVDAYCYRTFEQASDTATARTYHASRDGAEVDELDDLASTTDLAVAVDTAASGTFTALAEADFVAITDNRSGMVLEIRSATSSFPYSAVRRTVRVTGRFGWPETPEDVKRATMLWAIRLVNRRSTPTGVVGFGEFGGVRLSTIDPDVRALLAPYRRRGRLLR